MTHSLANMCVNGPENSKRSQFVAEYSEGPCPAVGLAMCESWRKGSSSAYNNGADIEAAKPPIVNAILPGTSRYWYLEFLPGGTAVNKAMLERSCTRRHHGLVSSEVAHVYTMEQNAVNAKAMLVKTDVDGPQAGCMDPTDLERVLLTFSPSMHRTRPVALTLTQPNEYGVIYSKDRLMQIVDCIQRFRKRGYRLFFHVDGSRLHNVLTEDRHANAVRNLLAFADGVTIGICKNGGPDCDAALFLSDSDIFTRQWVEEFQEEVKANAFHNCRGWDKAAGVAALMNGPYLDNARHANEMAAILARKLRDIQQLARIEIKYEVHTNAVFLDADATLLDKLAAKWRFATGLPGAAARFICSWRTSLVDVHELADDFRRVIIDRLNAGNNS